MGDTAGPTGLRARQERSRDGAVFAASLVSLGVLLRTTHSGLKPFRGYFKKLFTFFFSAGDCQMEKPLASQSASSFFPFFIFFYFLGISFLLRSWRKRLLHCSPKGFEPRARSCPSSSTLLRHRRCSFCSNTWCKQMLPAQHRPGTVSPTVVWMIQQITAAVEEQKRSHMLLLTSIY